MLSQSSIAAAYPLAQALAAKGWALHPCNETPLSQLVGASLLPAQSLVGVNADQLDSVPSFDGLLRTASMTVGPDGKIAHDEIMQSAVSAVAGVVAKNLYHARNVVNPQSEQVAKQVQEYINSRASGSLAPYSVVPFQYKAIWSSPLVREMVAKYSQTYAEDSPLQALGLAPAASLADTLYTGVQTFDAEIDQFLKDGAEERLQWVWSGLFGRNAGRSLSEVVRSFIDRTKVDDALIGFLFCRRIQEDIPEGINMDVSSWRVYISGLQAQLGRLVLNVLDRRELDSRNSNLVISYPTKFDASGEVLVIGDVYTRWLSDGGSPEILFGSLLSNQRTGYRELLDGSAEYTRTWNNEYRLRQSSIAADKYRYLVSGMAEAMSQLIAEMPDDQITGDRAMLHSRLKEQLAALRPNDLENIFLCARRVVCKTIWLCTDTEDMLNCIDEAAKTHSELDIREAALLGTVAFVSRWLAKLFTVDASTYQGK